MSELDDDELLDALGIDTTPEPAAQYTRDEERLIAGFEDIARFYAAHGRAPQHGKERDIFERLYAVRLDRLRALPAARKLLAPMDMHGLLGARQDELSSVPAALDDDELLSSLGVDAPGDDAITVLKHVRPDAMRRGADEVANRVRCKDFDQFQPLFEAAERELNAGIRKTARFGEDASIQQGDYFIVGGQMAYVAQVGETIRAPNGERDARLRVIYSNGTESDLLMRSLQRALYKDDTGRRLLKPDAGPLFGDAMDEDDQETGTIYVLRSQAELPSIAEHRTLIHKIGVTGGKVETRIANAKFDPTFLLAEVEVVATYKLSGINRVKLENLIHRIFAPAQLKLTIKDRFGHAVHPREWFLVPLSVIDEAVERIRDGSIEEYVYEPQAARLVFKTR